MLPENTVKALLGQAAETVDVTPSSGRAVAATAKLRSNRWLAVGAATATAAVVAGIAVAGGPGTSRVPSPHPVASSSPTGTPTEAAGGRVRVPILVKYTEAEAVQRLEEWGLLTEVEHRAVPCRPVGSVVEQKPRAATKVPAGSTVTLVVADRSTERGDCPQGVSFDDDRRVARLLYDFSRGVEGAQGPWSPSVTLSLQDTVWTTLTERQARDRDRWLLNVEPTNSPDVDVLGYLADSDGKYRVDIGPHPDCAGPTQPTARGLERLRQVSITPTGPLGSCLDWWALDVYLNEVDQVEYVSIHRWEW
jgi:hypothetical protein